MEHIYQVTFDTYVNNVCTNYFINTKASNQKQAKEIAKAKWIESHQKSKKTPHQFHMNAKRTNDSAIDDKFHRDDWNVVNKEKDPFWQWLYR